MLLEVRPFFGHVLTCRVTGSFDNGYLEKTILTLKPA